MAEIIPAPRRYRKSKARSPWDPPPKWRLMLVPPQKFRLLLALGPLAWWRAMRDPDHPCHLGNLIHTDGEARGRWRQWYMSLSQAQRSRYSFGCIRVKTPNKPPARIHRPDAFFPEQARIRRENAEMQAWARRTGKDPLFSPAYQERLRRAREALDKDSASGDRAPDV